MQQAIRRIVATSATATVGAGAVMGSSRTSETESLRTADAAAARPLSTADLQPTSRYVFEPEGGEESDVVCVQKKDLTASNASIGSPPSHTMHRPADMSPALRYAPQELLQTVNKVSPTPVEVDAAMKSITDHPEVLNNCLPNFNCLDESFRNSIIGAVKGILTPDIIQATQENIRHAQVRQLETSYDGLEELNCKFGGESDEDSESSRSRSSSSLSYGVGPYTAELPDGFLFEDSSGGGDSKATRSSRRAAYHNRSPTVHWEMLKDKYPCAICQDLLAAPSILNCSHSFCGSCLTDMIESCVLTNTDGDDDAELDELQQSCEIAYRCPQCKEEITNTTFERLLDSDIQRLVDAVPDCEAKKHWKERRGKFLKSQIGKRGAGKSAGAAGSRRRNWGPHSRYRSAAEEEDEEFWETVKEYAIPILGFAVLALICVCRMK